MSQYAIYGKEKNDSVKSFSDINILVLIYDYKANIFRKNS